MIKTIIVIGLLGLAVGPLSYLSYKDATQISYAFKAFDHIHVENINKVQSQEIVLDPIDLSFADENKAPKKPLIARRVERHIKSLHRVCQEQELMQGSGNVLVCETKEY